MRIENVDAILRRLALRQKWPIVGAVCCSIVSGLAALGPAFISGALIDALQSHETLRVTRLAIFILCATAVWGMAHALEGLLTQVAAERFGRDLRETILAKILRLPMKFFQAHNAGELTNRSDGDVEIITDSFEQSIEPTLSSALSFIITLVAMLTADWRLTLVGLVTVPLWLAASKPAADRLNAIQRRLNLERDLILGSLNESLSYNGATLIKTQNAENAETRHFRVLLDRILRQKIAQTITSCTLQSVLMVIVGLAPALILGVGAALVERHLTSLGTLIAFVSLQSRLYSPIGQIAGIRIHIARLDAIRPRLAEILEALPESTGSLKPRSEAQLSIENLEVSFNGRRLFSPINFEVQPGEWIAIIGPSGIGKSSILATIVRLHEPFAGEIRLDNQTVEKLDLVGLRDKVAIVTQHSMFFTRSLRENLVFGSEQITESALASAINLVDAQGTLARLKDGLDTIIGPDVKLSGGEMQRFAIARALLRKPRLLILDEATSALDSLSESKILSALRAAQGSMSTIIVTHRREVMKYADRIITVSPSKSEPQLASIDEELSALSSHVLDQ